MLLSRQGPDQQEDPVPVPAPSSSQSITDKILATFKHSDRSQGGSQASSGPSSSSLQAKEGAKVTKSGSAKETEAAATKGPAKEEVRLKAGSDSSASSVKSPKLSRTESMTERTVQKISKMVRGTSRSESRSKKTREPSSSPTLAPDHSQEKEKETEKTRSAQEKRDMFKSKKDP